jgi:hypothetical protein
MTWARSAWVAAAASAALGGCEVLFPLRGFGAAVDDAGVTIDGRVADEAPDASACAPPEGDTCDGACAPRVLAANEEEPFAIAVEPSPCGRVFWASRKCGNGEPGHVRAVDKRGGAAATIDEGCLSAIAADETHVAWAAYDRVSAARVDGSGLTVVASFGTLSADRLALFGATVVWTSQSGRGIRRHRIDAPSVCTTDCELVADPGSSYVASVAADEAGVYFVDVGYSMGGDGGVWMRKEGAAAVALGSARYAATLAVTQDRIYYGDDEGIWSVRRDGSNRGLLVPERAVGLAVRGERLYWTRFDGVVRTADLRGAGLETLASGLVGAGAIAVDDAAIYWVERGTDPSAADGKVVRLAR